MCTTMNELEKVVADYRSLKAMKEELDAQLKDAKTLQLRFQLASAEHWTVNSLKLISDHWQIIRGFPSTADYM